MDGAQIYQMVGGLGDAFTDAYTSARKQKLEEETPARLFDLAEAYSSSRGGNAAPSLAAGTSGAAGPKLPSFAGGSGVMRTPGSGGETETRFVDALKSGGLTNPYGLAAVAAYANHESGYKGANINGSWSDPSESGQAGTSGGILSWRGDRFANMRRLTAGAADPVTAQAKFTLTENPDLTMALQNAKSPEEANRLMADAWRFAGYNRPGGEFDARLGSTRQYVARLGGTPTATSPSAPTAVASAEPDAANLPANGAQPAGFVIPEGRSEAAPVAALASAGFAGFGSSASRMTPEMKAALNAAWRNPNTRSMAASVFSSLLAGKDSPWDIKDVNGQSSWVNTRTGQILGIGAAQRKTTNVGNNLVDQNTGEVIFTAPDRESTKPVSLAPGSTLVTPDGQPLFQAPDRDKTLETERKGREEAQGLRKEIQSLASFKNYEQALPIYQAMSEAAPRNSKAADLNLVYGLGKIMDPGSVVREGEMVMVKNTGSLPDWLIGTINGVNGGQVLTPETRQAIMTEAHGRMTAYEGSLNQDVARYRPIVERAKMNPGDVLPSFAPIQKYETPKKDAASDAKGGADKAPETVTPPKLGSVKIPMAAVGALRADPAMRDQFDTKYGKGASDRVLGRAKE